MLQFHHITKFPFASKLPRDINSALAETETESSPFWRNSRHWRHQKLSYNDNFWCRQWREFRQNDNISVSMQYCVMRARQLQVSRPALSSTDRQGGDWRGPDPGNGSLITNYQSNCIAMDTTTQPARYWTYAMKHCRVIDISICKTSIFPHKHARWLGCLDPVFTLWTEKKQMGHVDNMVIPTSTKDTVPWIYGTLAYGETYYVLFAIISYWCWSIEYPMPFWFGRQYFGLNDI